MNDNILINKSLNSRNKLSYFQFKGIRKVYILKKDNPFSAIDNKTLKGSICNFGLVLKVFIPQQWRINNQISVQKMKPVSFLTKVWR